MPGCMMGRPSANVAPTATPAWVVGTANALYAVANALTLDPGTVAKANETTATLRLTFPAPVDLKTLGIINTNLGGKTVTLSNNGGMTPIAVVVRDNPDGLCQSVWFDLRAVSGTSATQWDIAVTGADAPVAIGTVIALTSVFAPRVSWGYDLTQRIPDLTHTNSLEQDFIYDVPTRRRAYQGRCVWPEDYMALLEFKLDARKNKPFLFVMDQDDPDAMLVTFGPDTTDSFEFIDGRFDDDTVTGLMQQVITVKEVNAGVAL